MVYSSLYRERTSEEVRKIQRKRVRDLEARTNFPRLPGNLTFLFQSTQFASANSWGESRTLPAAPGVLVDEDTNATVVANAELNDIGGTGVTSTSPYLGGSYLSIPMADKSGKAAFYHGHQNHLKWEHIHPEVVHPKVFMGAKSFVLNEPGTSTADRHSFIHYNPSTDFNLTTSKSFAIWFYPTSLTAGDELYHMIHYRYIDASNYWMITFKEGDPKIYGFLNEAGTLSKTVTSNSLILNQWNLIIWTYNPTTDVLLIELNNAGSSTTAHTDTLTPPYTANTVMFIGGIPTSEHYRLRGYLAQFFGWSGALFSSTNRSNIWTYGTAVPA